MKHEHLFIRTRKNEYPIYVCHFCDMETSVEETREMDIAIMKDARKSKYYGGRETWN